MKKLLFFILFLITLGCAGPPPSPESETLNTQFHVTEVYQAKYSKVSGYIIYNGIKVPVDNGSSGYYYKEYRLYPGQIVNVTIQLDKKYSYNSVTIYSYPINLDNFVIE